MRRGPAQSFIHYLPLPCSGIKCSAVKVSKAFLDGMTASTNKTNWKRGRIIDFNIISLMERELSGSLNATNSLQLKAVAISTPSLLTSVIKPEAEEAGQEMQRREVTKEKGVEKTPALPHR